MVDVVAAEGASREVSADPATAVTVMPTADGEDMADQLPMVSFNSITFSHTPPLSPRSVPTFTSRYRVPN